MTNLKPLGARIIVKPLPPENKTATGIHLPNPPDETGRGRVLEVGPDVETLKPGDLILHPPFAGLEVKLEGETFRVLNLGEVVALLVPCEQADPEGTVVDEALKPALA